MSFSRLMLAQEQERAARERREAASAQLELASVRRRAAELVSQHEPLAEMGLDREAVETLLFDWVLSDKGQRRNGR